MVGQHRLNDKCHMKYVNKVVFFYYHMLQEAGHIRWGLVAKIRAIGPDVGYYLKWQVISNLCSSLLLCDSSDYQIY